jgi:hypothetical protein
VKTSTACSHRLSTVGELSVFLQQCCTNVLTLFHFDALADSVIVGGSIVEGFGNASSDLDLFVLTSSKREIASQMYFWRAASRWVDVSWIPRGDLAATESRLRAFPLDNCEWAALPAWWRSQIDLLHRLSTGIVLASPIIRQLPSPHPLIDRSILRRVASVQHLLAARSLWLDAIGALNSANQRQFRYVSRLCLDCAVDAWLAILDETVSSPKWRWLAAERQSLSGADPLHVFRYAPEEVRRSWSGADCLVSDRDIVRASGLISAVTAALASGVLTEKMYVPNSALVRFEHTPDQCLSICINGEATSMRADDFAKRCESATPVHGDDRLFRLLQ